MTKIKAVLMSPYLLLIFCIIIYLTFSSFRLGLIRFSPSAASQEITSFQGKELAEIDVANKTSGFLVMNLNRTGADLFRLELKNTYKKTITAFRFSIGPVQITEELAYNKKRTILPNTIFTKDYPTQLTLGDDKLIILAVVFEDGTADGDSNTIREITEMHLGKQRAYEYFLGRVQLLLNSADTQSMEDLEKIRSEIANLPEERGMSGYMRRGFNRGKQDLLEELQQVQSNLGRIRPEMED
jgi:hypothetical protein